MRKHFAAYYRPTVDELRKLHVNAVVSVDANVLLNLYRYSAETRDEFVALLERIKPQLWITHQAAKEYQDNRLKVIATRLGTLADLRKTLETARAQLTELYRSPSKESQDRWAKVTDAWGALGSYIDERVKEAVQPTSDVAADLVWNRVTTLFDGRVGDAYPADDRRKWIEEGKQRFEHRVPPGYLDANKGGEEQFGDWLIWRQLLDHAKSESKPIVLVTDDQKGRLVGLRERSHYRPPPGTHRGDDQRGGAGVLHVPTRPISQGLWRRRQAASQR